MASAATILVAEDDHSIRLVLTQALMRQGYIVRITESAATLWSWIQSGEGDLVISDVMMPDGNGLDLLPKIQKERPDLRVIIISAQNTLSTAVHASQGGAFEYLPKPFDINKLLQTIDRALTDQKGTVTKSISPEVVDESLPLIGRSAAMQEIYRLMARLIKTDLTVLINGESGTGKELVAKALHEYGDRQNGPFIAVNMGAIPKDLIESELFGHEKGAFTGAVAKTTGRFEQAKGGTLFLDEIGDMPLEAQTRLLRVLQEGEYISVGGRQAVKVDVRIVAATHRDLKQLIQEGLFREDLYYRLSVVPIRLPSLRERLEDIPELAQHFLKLTLVAEENIKIITPMALNYLQQHHWPGNVRELENLIRRIVALYSEEVIDDEIIRQELGGGVQPPPLMHSDVPSQPLQIETEMTSQALMLRSAPESLPLLQNISLGDVVTQYLQQYFKAHEGDLPAAGLYERIVKEVEKPLILLSLQATRHNQIKAAQLLGINRNTLRKKIKDLEIEITKPIR